MRKKYNDKEQTVINIPRRIEVRCHIGDICKMVTPCIVINGKLVKAQMHYDEVLGATFFKVMEDSK